MVTCRLVTIFGHYFWSGHYFRAGLRPAPESRPEGAALIFYAALQHGFHSTFYSFRASTAHIVSPNYAPAEFAAMVCCRRITHSRRATPGCGRVDTGE
jgi:hypothetical protein